jgi:putative hydrolase of the HAD superfamily
MPDVPRRSRWVIFDADNTLWDVETLYDRARNEYCAYVEGLLLKARPETKVRRAVVDILQRHRDVQLHSTHGYSAARFARSFEDTLSFLLPFTPPGDIQHVRELALQVFVAKPELRPGLEATLSALSRDFSLGIVTAGERWVQEKRLADFEFRDRFDDVAIVERKTEATFEDFCSSRGVDKGNSWVVGDSLQSDIIPSTKIGLRAIHFEAPNWTVEHGQKPEDVPAAQTMEDVLRLIRAASCQPKA